MQGSAREWGSGSGFNSTVAGAALRLGALCGLCNTITMGGAYSQGIDFVDKSGEVW